MCNYLLSECLMCDYANIINYNSIIINKRNSYLIHVIFSAASIFVPVFRSPIERNAVPGPQEQVSRPGYFGPRRPRCRVHV